MNSEHILEQHRDHDTLGGRISRAREALGMEQPKQPKRLALHWKPMKTGKVTAMNHARTS